MKHKFKKGYTPWNKGKKMPREVVEKQIKSRTGFKHSEETKKKISLIHTGRKTGRIPKTAFVKGGIPWNKGKKGVQKCSEETRKKMSDFQKSLVDKGTHHFFIDGKWNYNSVDRRTSSYKNWRLLVYKRDNYTCKKCGSVGNNLNAHHIKSFTHNIEYRLKVYNGITFCKKCHIRFHKIYGRKNTFNQLIKFLNENK